MGEEMLQQEHWPASSGSRVLARFNVFVLICWVARGWGGQVAD